MLRTKYVRVSEEEYDVMDKIQSGLKELDEIQSNMDKLNKELPKSINRITQEKLSQIKQTNEKIENVFNKIHISVNIAKQKLIRELSVIQESVEEDQKNNDDMEYDEKKFDAFEASDGDQENDDNVQYDQQRVNSHSLH